MACKTKFAKKHGGTIRAGGYTIKPSGRVLKDEFSTSRSRQVNFAEGGVLGTDPKKKNTVSSAKSLRVVGSAPIIKPGSLPFSLNKFSSLLTRDQNNELLGLSQADDISSDQGQLNFINKLKSFGLDTDNIRDQTFINEFNRTRAGFEQNFPGGVSFTAAHGEDELRASLADLGENEDVALLDHFSPSRIFGTQIGNLENINDPLGRSPLSEIFKETVGDRNCYLGICHGEDTANTLVDQGVNTNFFARPARESFTGPNPSNAEKGFESFFFGIGTDSEAIDNPTLGRDFLNISNNLGETPEVAGITDTSPVADEFSIEELNSLNRF